MSATAVIDVAVGLEVKNRAAGRPELGIELRVTKECFAIQIGGPIECGRPDVMRELLCQIVLGGVGVAKLLEVAQHSRVANAAHAVVGEVVANDRNVLIASIGQ